MRDLDARPLHRVKGRQAIARSLRGLLIRVHRFGRARATTPADITWTVVVLDRLQRALDVADPQPEEL